MKSKSNDTEKNTATAPKQPNRLGGLVKTGFAAICLSVLGAGVGYVYIEVINLDKNIVATTGELKADIDQQKQRNESIDTGITSLQLAMSDAKEANQSIAETMGLLSDQIATLSTNLTDNIAAVTQKQKTISTEVAALTRTTSTQSKVIEKAQSQIATARTDFENFSNFIGQQVNGLSDGMADQQTRIETISASFADAGDALKGANQTIADLETRYTALQSEMTSMQGNLADQKTQIEELTSGFASVRDELALSRAALENTGAEAAASVTATETSENPQLLESAPITSIESILGPNPLATSASFFEEAPIVAAE